jgi:hypothetical protein
MDSVGKLDRLISDHSIQHALQLLIFTFIDIGPIQRALMLCNVCMVRWF